MNKLLNLANQMGLIQNVITKNLSNATQCLSRSGVQESHMKKGKVIVYKFEDICGMIILLAIGLGAAVLALFGELVWYEVFHKTKSSTTKLHARKTPTKIAQAWPDTKM